MGKEKKNGFILQAGILAAAGVVTRIIGILYRSPLVAIIGDEGNGYYSAAYTIYTIILLVSTNGIPSAVSKIVAGKLAKKEYRNAHKILIGAFCYVFVAGGLASLACFFFADTMAGENSAMVLKVFTPTIFFSGILGVFRGYFQAHGSMLQTSFSQVLEQIANALVSIGAAVLFLSFVSQADTTTQAVYGAMGSAVGTGIGVVIALLFMIIVYRMNSPMFQARRKRDRSGESLSYKQVFTMILTMVTPVILSTCIYNVSSFTNLQIYSRISETLRGYTEAQIATAYGYFSGKANPITNIPIAFATAMSIAIIPAISGSYEKGNKKETRDKIGQGIKTAMLISIPSAVGMAVLAKPVVYLLYPQPQSLETVSKLLMIMSPSVVFYGLSTVTNGVLQATGYVNKPVIHASVALIVQTIVLAILLIYTPADVSAMSVTAVLYSLCVSLLNGISLRRKLQYHQEIVKTFMLPVIAAAGMGAAAYGIYWGMEQCFVFFKLKQPDTMSWSLNCISLMISVFGAAVLYFLLIIKLKAIEKQELQALPKGTFIVRIAQKLHLL